MFVIVDIELVLIKSFIIVCLVDIDAIMFDGDINVLRLNKEWNRACFFVLIVPLEFRINLFLSVES